MGKVSRAATIALMFSWSGGIFGDPIFNGCPRFDAFRNGPRYRRLRSSEPMSGDYWKYCAIDGWLCRCCGGTSSICPPDAST
jgi:hypothetical protein